MSDDSGSKSFKPTELVKKVLTAGMGAVFLTEDSLKALINEIKLPKEMIGGVLDSANRTRKEFMQSISQDVITRVTEKVDLKQFVAETLAKNEIEMEVKLRFIPREGGGFSMTVSSNEEDEGEGEGKSETDVGEKEEA